MSTAGQKRREYRSQARTSPGLNAALVRLGRRVRLLRQERGLTQEEAAGQAKLDGKHFQEIEAGRVNVTMATLLGVAKAFGVPLSELLDGVWEP